MVRQQVKFSEKLHNSKKHKKETISIFCMSHKTVDIRYFDSHLKTQKKNEKKRRNGKRKMSTDQSDGEEKWHPIRLETPKIAQNGNT